MLLLQAIVASLGLANAAVVTVTNHVHADALVSVEGVLYVENGQTKTSFITEGGAQPTAASDQVSGSVVSVTSPSDSQIPSASSTPPSGSIAIVTETAGSSPSPSPSPSPSDSDSAAPQTTSATESASSSFSWSAAPQTTPATETASVSASGSSAPQTSSSAFASVDAQVASEPSSSSVSVTPSASSSSADTTTLSPSSSQEPSTTSSSAAPSDSSAPSSGSSDFQNTMVDGHNDKRSKHQSTGPLDWDDDLANYAQNYADKYDCSGNLVHSNGPYGENLAVGYDDQGTIDAWYNEIAKYSYSDPVFSEATGHFTQLVWKSSTKIGCGSKQCGGSVGKYVICNYNPAGNFIGDFSENVLPTL